MLSATDNNQSLKPPQGRPEVICSVIPHTLITIFIMPQKTRHKPKQEQEGAAQVPVAAPPITCQRAPRKKASEPSEEAASQPLQPSTTQARKRKRHTRTASTASTASQPRVKEPARQPRRVEAPRQPRRQEEPKAKPKKPAEPSNALEKRAKPWLEEPPEGFVVRTQRLTLDRLFILGHTITGVNDNPVISFDIVGSTGNIYNTIIRKVPTCDCPDARFRRAQCKHICYGMPLNSRLFLPTYRYH